MRRLPLLLGSCAGLCLAVGWLAQPGSTAAPMVPSLAATAEAPANQLVDESTVPLLVDLDSRVAADTWPDAPEGSSLQLGCLYATGSDQAIVAGAVKHPDGSSHSALFATRDGGVGWQPIGPAMTGERVLDVHAANDAIRALTTTTDGRLALLRSDSATAEWHHTPIHVDGLPVTPISETMQAWIDDQHAVVHLRFRDGPATWYQLVTGDGGSNWSLTEARDGLPVLSDQLHDQPPAMHTGSGWSWRLNDQVIERRHPDSTAWFATLGQPADGYTPPETDTWFVKLVR